MQQASNSNSDARPKHRHSFWYIFGTLVGLFGLYGLLSYIVLPGLWRHYEHNPKLEHSPKTTQTAEGISGDPLNIGFVGTTAEVVQTLLAVGWYPADPITLRSSAGIAKSVLLKDSYPTAPVSNLYLWGRKQDVSFELPVGNNAKARHHVRLWQSNDLSSDHRPLWLGSATFDQSVELSHRTGQITHRIGANIDLERDNLINSIGNIHQIAQLYQVTGVGATWQGHNGGGDKYYTDGELTICVLSMNSIAQTKPLTLLPNPEPVNLKNEVWSWLRHYLK
ncbi:MAG: LssY C-terminal domain-containing protein [Nostoc sp. NMS7]|uniref:LssY C-terminal domain-containing protein n=1 Tax=Nostoc sp. NMS7 TaxID=2815391 RepID=UPI0025FC1D78|nr:LssY C-terminal domain-containing protein [Nostoc sp. NMS7]MBN3948083.1 LssY C-terminal domain-containing protein [Nostoc sp. NMS7]